MIMTAARPGPGLVRAIVMERISAAKKLSRPEIELNEWSRRGYAQSNILDTEVFNNNMCQYLINTITNSRT